MDPTAPNDNNQDSQGGSDSQSPIQPGGFVVSDEPGAGQATQAPIAQDPQSQPQPFVQDPTPPTPSPLASDLESDLQSTVASATGANLAGISDPAAQAPQENLNPIDSGPLNQSSQDLQPDPTPFVPPGQDQLNAGAPIPPPVPPITPVGSGQPGDGSKSAKLKSLIIIVGIFILVAILAAVAWYFILNKGSNESTTTTNTNPVELPTSAPTRNDSGFGNIPSPLPEASESTDVNSVPEEGVVPESTVQ